MLRTLVQPKTKIDFRTRFVKGLQPLDTGHNIHTPFSLCDKILKKVKPNSTQTIAIFYTIEFAIVLIEDYGIDPKKIWLFGDSPEKKKIANHLGINYNNITPIIEGKQIMKFDVIVGNPPFNIRDENDETKTKVSGNTKLFKDFAKKTISMVKQDGIFAFITPKMIYRTLKEKPFNSFELIDFNYMSDRDWWKYNTCYWIIKNNGKGLQIKLSDRIFSKFIDIEGIDTFQTSDINKSDLELIRDDQAFGKGKKVIRFLPGSRGPNVTYDFSDSDKVSGGASVIITSLDSFSSITATDEPTLVGTSTKFHFNNMDEAEKIKLFLLNNPLIRFVKKRLKMKKSIAYFSHFKKFDINQISTGKEYPIEYNLTPDEIKEIENEIK